MNIEMHSIESIKSLENNLGINDSAVDAKAKSVRKFGFRQPILVDEQGVIILGHTRLEAAGKCGLEKVPVHVTIGLEEKRP